jgi:glutamyl-tRNA synthetase
MSIRTRFAPSPTGDLHLGSARTALYSWLYARKLGGKFILRIEDTDRERSTQAAIDAILQAMEWLGLDCDEGPIYQMHRLERYHAVADQLIKEGFAYRCSCSKERIEKLREKQTANKEKPRYDGHCRDKNIPADFTEPFVIRFRNPVEGAVNIEDYVHGMVQIQNSELDDLIMIRSDNVPTYNFGVVVDDLDMNISHVIRGDDHLANTPRQINIIKALGGKLPIYVHIPMILGSDGKRLSKRHGAVSVQHYQEQGILPDALLNYLVRLGWSHGDQEIFSREEMVSLFDIDHLNKAPSAFNPEKLLWLNQHYIKTSDPADLVLPLKHHMEKLGLDSQQGPALEELIVAQRERAKTLEELAEKSSFFYREFEEIPADVVEKNLKPEVMPGLKVLREKLAAISEWKAEDIHKAVIDTAESLDLKLGKLAQPLRVAVTGNTMSPSIDITLQLIGKDRVLARIDRVLAGKYSSK